MAKVLTQNVIGCLTLILLLSACGSSVQQLEVTATPTTRPTLSVPTANELNLRSVEWFVITRDNAEERFQELERRGIPVAFFAVTGEGYEHLSLNLNDIRSHVEQLNSIIVAYERYYQ